MTFKIVLVLAFVCLLAGCAHDSHPNAISYSSHEFSGFSINPFGITLGSDKHRKSTIPNDSSAKMKYCSGKDYSYVEISSVPKKPLKITNNINNISNKTINNNHAEFNSINKIDNSLKIQTNNNINDYSTKIKTNSDNSNTKINSENKHSNNR
jgi:hypothetical protein